jgi:hypothetical protein
MSKSAAIVVDGIYNTGPMPLTFYWFKWSARPGLPTP